MINPAEINLDALPWLPLDAKTVFPTKPAIYFAIDSQGAIQYIGKSKNPKVRWGQHHRYEQLRAIGGVRIVYLFVDAPELLLEIESALIEWFDPPLNVFGRNCDRQPPLATDNQGNLKRLRDVQDSDKIKRVVLKVDDLLEEVQERNGITLGQIAQDLDMNARSITNLKRGTERGDWATAFRLARYLSEKLGRNFALEDLFSVEEGL